MSQHSSSYRAEKACICLAVTCGLPGAGKTSLCKALSASCSPGILVRHVCFDDEIDIDRTINEDTDVSATLFKASRQQVLRRIEQCMLEAAHQWPTLVLADDNMYYRSMRYECAQLARRHNVAFMQLYLPCSLDAALVRNAQREGSKKMPEEVIRRMAARLEEPDGRRNEWEQNTITLPPEGLPPLEDPQGWTGVWSAVLAAWGGRLPPAAAPQQQGAPTEASASAAHSLDLQLRRMLAGATAAASGAAEKADVARRLNAKRKQLLASMCTGDKVAPSVEVSNSILRTFRESCDSAQERACQGR